MTRRAWIIVAAVAAVAAAMFLTWYVLMIDRTIEHGDRMALSVEVGNAMDAPGGPDYQREIAAYRRFLPEGEDRRLNIALAELAACKAKRAPCDASPKATEAQAVAMLERLATEARSDDVRASARNGLARRDNGAR